MSRYEIIPAKLSHIRELNRTMRPDDRAEIEKTGLIVRHALFHLWRETIAPRTALVDGEVAACWGDAGPMLGDEGLMWLFTAPPIEKLPLAYFRETRREIAAALRHRRVLRAHVLCGYGRAERFFHMLGFRFSEPRQVGAGLYREIRIERHGR
jgi:hypothetical protein